MGKDAVIIGGSIGGLMCGVMLKHHGYNVTILEQEISPRREGYDAGIKVGPANEEFLKRHDRVKRDMIVKCDPGFMIDVNGRPRPQRGQTMLMTSWGLMVSVLRANFDSLASMAVPVAPESQPTDGKAEFRFGTRVTDIEDDNGKVKVNFLNAESGIAQTLFSDIAIVADGSNSHIRNTLLPEVKREYSGYMCWRGTVREGDIDEKWNQIYSEKATFHRMERTYLLNYTIPTDNGDLTRDQRLHNWIWYSNHTSDSPEMTPLFTDRNGTSHHGTVPRGLVRPDLWEKQKDLARTLLPLGLAAIVSQSKAPFVTKVYDVASTKASFFGGKVFLVGDAQTTLRPNVGMGTTHAANDCNELEKVIDGSATPEQWERAVLRWGAAQRRFAMASVGIF
ncbi:hypothetical protein E8E12_005542 [Didymella heteroderae]|uniref:2,6-dihydroxypyridine 3-monooxygenase substrate binding domain-containing protein n=1 Tax=Didymella heteroderae TaxID=1769908 RepID=A0A9P4WLS6_9PLEO|nr:hypothetical protein E8E12_005542 [Didymella heteroderae]